MEFQFDALTTLRVLCGVWFLPHIIGKLRNMERAAPTFEKVGLRPGRVFVILTVACEVLAGIGLVTGIFEKIAAGLAVLVLVGASYAVVRINGLNWRWQKQGPEYMIFWASACILSVLR
ncbi:DoxX family protein [Bradyrhizobium jicamae]|nr:DoxX family protein [Bradyrhizobium jicamae]